MKKLNEQIINCTKCNLSKTRTNAVCGVGDIKNRIMIIGEAPGKNEDEEGRPFVGRAGKILTEVLDGLGIERSGIFITNIVKCRPPKNRVPKKDEISACNFYLQKQIDMIDPRLIIALGRSCIKTMTGESANLAEIHGKYFNYQNRWVLAAYHPAAVIYNRKLMKELESDLKQIISKLR